MSVTKSIILARHVSSQGIYEFDRTTGIAVRHFSSRAVHYTIDSIAAPPEDVRDIILELDEKYRDGEYQRAENPEWKPPADAMALTQDQIRAYLFLGDLYRANPI